MKTIYKYQLSLVRATATCKPVIMPFEARILHVGAQGDDMFIWAEIDTEASGMEWFFEVFGTGHEMLEDMGVERHHIGSLMMHDGASVFHVYHRTN